MANVFIPQLWAAKVLAALEKAHVYGAAGVVNRDYEGEIKGKGDTVHIRTIGDITVKEYTVGSALADPDDVQGAEMLLTISESKYFNFKVDDVLSMQGGDLINQATGKAAYAVRDTSDSYIAGVMAAGAATANLIGTSASPKTDLGTAGYAYEYLVDLGVLLDDASVPTEGRWVVVPSWFHGLLLTDSKFVSGTAGADATRVSGQVGEAAGFKIYKSANVPNTSATKYKIVAGHPMAVSYAEQINKVETYRIEKGFGDGVKGLHLYGAKVLRPDALAVLTANKPS